MARQPLRTGVPWDIQTRFRNLGAPGVAREERQPITQVPSTRLIYPPRIEKLPESQDFRVQDFTMSLGAGVGDSVTSSELAFTLPRGAVGWLQSASVYVLNMTAAADISFRIRINQGPVQGFADIRNSPGVANLYRENLNEMRVRIPNGATVDIIVVNIAGGAFTVGGMLAGWFHSEQAEIARFGGDF